MNVSPRNSTAMQRGLRVIALILFVMALERFVNAAMASSEVGTHTAWMLGSAFALAGTMLLGLLLFIGGAGRTDRIDAAADSSPGRQQR